MSNEEGQTQQHKFLAQGERFLGFSLGSEEYAIPLLVVKEVIAVPEITSIPFTPPHFLGIMNLRGQVISIMDMRTKLGIKPNETPEKAVIICDLSPLVLGVVVDSINAVISPKSNEIMDKPNIQSSKASDYITGVFRRDSDLVLLLDIARALNVEDLQAVNRATKTNVAA